MKRILIFFLLLAPGARAAEHPDLLAEAAKLAGYTHGSALMCNLDSSMILQAYRGMLIANAKTSKERAGYDEIFRREAQAGMRDIPRPNAKNACTQRKAEVRQGLARMREIDRELRRQVTRPQRGVGRPTGAASPARPGVLTLPGTVRRGTRR